MSEERIQLIIQDKYIEMMGHIINQLRGLPLSSMAGEISTAVLAKEASEHLWEVFVEQMRRDEDTELYRACSDIISELCHQMIEQLTTMELQVMWSNSEACHEWEGDSEAFPQMHVMIDDVSEELVSWLEQEAEDPELDDVFDDDKLVAS